MLRLSPFKYSVILWGIMCYSVLNAGQIYEHGNNVFGFPDTYIDTYTDSRDGETYRVFRTVKRYKKDVCSPGASCIDTGYVYLFAENLRYATEGSVCAENSCRRYGRYYPLSEAGNACPDGWEIASLYDMSLTAGYRILNDTVYVVTMATIRREGTVPEPGERMERKRSLPDVSSGWFNTTALKQEHLGDIGTVWVRDRKTYDIYPWFVDFGDKSAVIIDSIIHGHPLRLENKYPVKCYRETHPSYADPYVDRQLSN